MQVNQLIRVARINMKESVTLPTQLRTSQNRAFIMNTLKNTLTSLFLLLSLSSCANNPELLETAIKIAQQSGAGSSPLSIGEISSGLKEALRVGSSNVVSQLGVNDGFNADPLIHIPLPDSVKKIRNIAAKVGLQSSFDDLETKLNRAAETATPKAKKLLWNAIAQMTLQDAKGILSGPDDSATRYFQSKMSAPLSRAMEPIVTQAMSQVGVVQAYDQAVGRLGPFATALPDYKTELTNHVIRLGMEGIFTYIAKEEAAIRHNPAKRVTAILRRVFGS